MRVSMISLIAFFALVTGCAQPPAKTVTVPAPSTEPALPVIASQPADTPVAASSAAQPTLPASTTADTSTYVSALRPQAASGLRLDGLTRYCMDVTIAPGLDKLAGRADIRYTNREAVALDRVYLHLYPNLWDAGMAVSDTRVNGRKVEAAYPSGDDVLGLPLDPALPPGASVDLALRFEIVIPAGEGVGNYGEFARQENILALAHFYPTVAVYDGGWRIETPAPQGDVIFSDASLYDITLTAPAGLVVVASGATLDRATRADGSGSWRLGGGPMRDFNIVASSDFRLVTGKAGEVTVNSYYLPADDAGGRRALGWAIEALRVYEQAFGPYPYRELDIAATGTRAAGIEYPGLIAIAQRLYNDPERQTLFESATVHEVAHQWWYNVVGNDQLNDPWLDEALAQYSAYLYFRSMYGAAGGEGFLAAMNDRWGAADLAEIPIGLPVSVYADREYSAIVYGRGPLFFVALARQIGEAKMAELLQRYYREQTWDIATPSEFRMLALAIGGSEIDALLRQWVDPK